MIIKLQITIKMMMIRTMIMARKMLIKENGDDDYGMYSKIIT